MYKVLLVDDDETERQGLAGLAVFPNNGMTIAAEAWNGSRALELAKSLRPDVVLTDIRMPVMDGVTFAARVKEEFPNLRIVMMSGYEDFSAAKQALSFGADAYLTKPLNIAELERTLARVAASLNTDADRAFESVQLRKTIDAMRPHIRELLLRDLLLGVRTAARAAVRDELAAAGLFAVREKLAVLLLETARDNDPAGAAILQIQEVLSGMSAALTLSEPIAIHSGRLAFIAFLPRRMNDEMAFDHLQQCAGHMMEQVRAGAGLQITVAISSVTEDESQLAALYSQAFETLRHYAGYGANRIYWHESPGTELPLPDSAAAAEILKSLFRSGGDTRAQVTALFEGLMATGASLETIKTYCCELLARLMAATFPALAPKDGGSLFAPVIAARYVYELRGYIDTLLLVRPGEAVSQPKSNAEVFAEKAAAFIRENYRAELSADHIAQELFITPAHLRRVFKNVTGQTIQEYLLSVRMARAGELLRTANIRVLEVARAVGYENPSYFNIVFRKYYGKAPGEFRNSGGDGHD